MTGFARAEGEHETERGSYRWIWEIRSLNSKGLDFKCRLPSWLDNLEADVRKLTTAQFSRGSINVGLQIRSDADESRVQLNEEVLSQIIAAAKVVETKLTCAPPTVDGILGLRGVLSLEEIEEAPESRKTLVKVILSNFAEALNTLIVSRQSEGEKIQSVILQQVADIETLVGDARTTAETVPRAIQARLEAQLKDLLKDDFPTERIAQETALLAVKSDVREELDRLDAHISAAKTLLVEGVAIGRRFDFLMQEYNREANTLCSKAQTIELKKIGLDLKAVIDQLREQIQNIE